MTPELKITQKGEQRLDTHVIAYSLLIVAYLVLLIAHLN